MRMAVDREGDGLRWRRACGGGGKDTGSRMYLGGGMGGAVRRTGGAGCSESSRMTSAFAPASLGLRGPLIAMSNLRWVPFGGKMSCFQHVAVEAPFGCPGRET